jgi:hypothetical protein
MRRCCPSVLFLPVSCSQLGMGMERGDSYVTNHLLV